MKFFLGPSFPLLYALLFIYLYFHLGKSYKHSGNILLYYFTNVLLYTSIIFFLFSIPVFIFPSGSLVLSLTTNVLGYFVSYIAVAYFSMYASYLFFPNLKSIYFFISTFLIGVFITIADFMTLQMSTVNEYGLVNRHINTGLLFVNNLLIAIVFLPSCGYLIYRSIKKGYIIRGILFGAGVALLSFFLPIMLQTQNIFIYVFFNTGCVIGGALLTLSLTVFSSHKFSS